MQSEHKHITERGLTEDGGIIFIFDDNSHTYIEPLEAANLVIDYMKMVFDNLGKQKTAKLIIPYKEE